MKVSHVLIPALVATLSLAQTSTPQQNATGPAAENSSRFASGTELRVELEKSVDAKKAKAGDPVFAKTMDELKSGTQVIAPRGAKVMGHVVAAEAHEKNSPSRLEIAFDKLEAGNGSEIPMKAAIQALQKTANNAAMASDNMGVSPWEEILRRGQAAAWAEWHPAGWDSRPAVQIRHTREMPGPRPARTLQAASHRMLRA